MTKLARACVLGLALFTFGVFAGCGGGDEGPTRYEVSGDVTLGGKPLENGTIQFEPQGPPEIAGGAVIENGKYTIAEEDGLPEGKYTVRISSAGGAATPTPEVPGETPPPAPELIPPEFNVNSDKTIEVGPDKENVFDFTIP